MEKITFTKLETTDKNGQPLVGKNGKPYTRHTLKVESRGDRYISGFMNETTRNWQIGDEVDILITESTATDRNGNPYLNWSLPKKEDKVNDKLEDILNKIVGLTIEVRAMNEFVRGKSAKVDAQVGYPTEDINPDDVPF